MCKMTKNVIRSDRTSSWPPALIQRTELEQRFVVQLQTYDVVFVAADREFAHRRVALHLVHRSRDAVLPSRYTSHRIPPIRSRRPSGERLKFDFRRDSTRTSGFTLPDSLAHMSPWKPDYKTMAPVRTKPTVSMPQRHPRTEQTPRCWR